MVMEHHYLCPYCWQENDIFLYPDDGERQQTVVDCRVCCQPATIDAGWNPVIQAFELSVEREAGE